MRFLRLRAQQVSDLNEKQNTVVDIAFHSKTLLREQRSDILNQANFWLNLQETKAEHAVRNMEQQVREQSFGVIRSDDCEASRHGQLHLFAELRDRDEADSKSRQKIVLHTDK